MDVIAFEPQAVAIGGVLLLPLVFGLVEFIKSVFGLEGKAVTILSFAVGFLGMCVVQFAEMYPGFGQWAVFVVLALTMGMSASGFYKFVDARTTKEEDYDLDLLERIG